MTEQNELQILNKTDVSRTEAEGHNNKNQQDITAAARWTKLLVFAGYASTLGSAVPAGYCIGVMNSPAVFMRHWCNETLIQRYDVNLSAASIDLLWSAIVSIFLIGGAIGSLTGAGLANKFGRKGCILICGVLFFVGAICFFFCRTLSSVEILLLGRFIVGIASGLTTACLPMYLSEIAPLALRGTLGVFCAVGFTAGVVVGQIFSLRAVFGTESHWHIALSFYVILVILCYLPFFLYPESPKWLYVVKEDREEAQALLMRLRGTVKSEILAKELEVMEAEANLVGQVSSFIAVLKDHKLLMPLIIVCVYQGGQQLSGINAIFYYSVSIFRRAGMTAQAAEWANLGAGSLNLATSLLGPMLMAKINRRPLMLMSSLVCSFFLLSFALMLNFIDSVSWFAQGCIACIFLYIFFFQFGVGPIPFFIGSELFEVSPRPVAMSLGSLSSWSCNFIIGMTFPSLQNAWGSFVFLPFSITCFIMFLLTKFYLPETRGRDPSKVAPLISNGFKSKIM
ncbi:solute carrier family 2, facilitated glucose transporter member 1-like isoform X1 [Lucilia sericata]|uniref:solute carrier family 2, facilitated glucose transporter member 1-like isoform X1 n=2 Tax=Lucilia sericata TaxID=13632 RepID=UPI0018A83202|nr:solute carrier family 2, facilitated glucose transporter member 1-like isoform X1 [Lucilia sericata]